MQTLINKDASEELTNRLWTHWKNNGTNPRGKTWLEIKKLSDHFLKLCRDQERDYQEYDFLTLVDSSLNYYENFAEIENQLGASTISDKEYYAKLMDEAAPEISALEENEKLEEKNVKLQEKMKKVSDDLSIEVAKRAVLEAENKLLKEKHNIQLQENFLSIPKFDAVNTELSHEEMTEVLNYLHKRARREDHRKKVSKIGRFIKAILI